MHSNEIRNLVKGQRSTILRFIPQSPNFVFQAEKNKMAFEFSLILKVLFDDIVWTKNQRDFDFLRFSALISKQKSGSKK